MAASLGVRVTLITRLSSTFDRSAIAGMELQPQHGGVMPRYANSYGLNGDRTQLLLSPGEPLTLPPVMGMGDFDALMLAPAFQELERAPQVSNAVVCVSLQGPLRTRDAACVVGRHADPLAVADRFIHPGWYAFFSEEDTDSPDELGRYISERGGTAFLTRGYRGATLFEREQEPRELPAIPANLVDPTGAGDCFATAFMVRMAETRDLALASTFALAAGALTVERPGVQGIPTRAEVEARLAREVA